MEQRLTHKYDVLNLVNEKLTDLYKRRSTGKQDFFVNNNGVWFNVFAFPGELALCVEYAGTDEDAKLNRFEDGDQFYLADYETVDALLAAIIEETESAAP